MIEVGGVLYLARFYSVVNAVDACDPASDMRLWTFEGKAPILGSPISYRIGDRQFVTVLMGTGSAAGS